MRNSPVLLPLSAVSSYTHAHPVWIHLRPLFSVAPGIWKGVLWCPQEQTNILSSPFPIISIRLWQIGHLAFVVRDTVSRYPQARSWHTRSFAFFPLTASNRFPQFGHFLFVMFSWRKVPSSLRISCSSSLYSRGSHSLNARSSSSSFCDF